MQVDDRSGLSRERSLMREQGILRQRHAARCGCGGGEAGKHALQGHGTEAKTGLPQEGAPGARRALARWKGFMEIEISLW